MIVPQIGYWNSKGYRLAYREYGSGPLLIILPGNTASSAYHLGELEYFGSRCRAVALDPLGTGLSQRLEVWPEDWWQQLGRDAISLIDHLGEREAVLVGTSGGAVAALWAGIYAPERVRAVIADSTEETPDPAMLRAEILNRQRKDAGQVQFWSGAHGPDWEQVVDADSRVCLALANRGGDWFEGRLGEIRCPVLFSASLNDDLLSDVLHQVPAMAAKVPAGQAFLLNNGGPHPLMWSRPVQFRAAAGAFLSSLAPSSSPTPLE
jgi:pimeloyl-ACP methyl ester carboxylesterase